jgi:hypothetical protein
MLDLAPLAPLFGARALSVGKGEFHLNASGPAGAPRIAGRAFATRPRFDDVWADSLALRADAVLADAELASADARVLAHALIAGPILPRDVDVRAQWDGRVLGVESKSRVDADRSEELVLRFEPGPRQSRLRIERLAIDHSRPFSLQHPVDIELGERFHVDDLVLERHGIPLLAIDGGIDSTGEARLSVKLDSLNVARTMEAIGGSEPAGSIWAEALLTGTRSQPVFEASLRGDLRTGKRPPGPIAGRLSWAEGDLDCEFEFEQTPKNRLAFRGKLPAVLTLEPGRGERAVTFRDAPLTAVLEAQGFDCSWFESLVPPQVARDMRGFLDGRVEAGGDYANPSLSGSLTLGGASVRLPRLGARYKGEIALGFSGRTVVVQPSVVKSGAGQVQLSGQATLEGRGRHTVDLKTDWNRFQVMNSDLAKIEVSGHLAATGHPSAPEVAGDMTVLNTTVNLSGAESGRAVEEVELTEDDLRELHERFGRSVKPKAKGRPALVDSTRLDATVTIGQNVWARRNTDPVVALEMVGKVRATKERAARLNLTGELGVETGRSYMSFQGRRFEMTEARIDLPGPVERSTARLEAVYNPLQSGNTSSNAATVTATVVLDQSGTKIDLRSDPYMDQASLLNYLATGETQGGFSSGSAYGLAVGSAIGALGGAAGRSLGFQVVQVTQDSYGGQTLSAGNYINPRVYLGFRQPVVEGQKTNTPSRANTYSTEFEVELEAIERLLLNLQGGGAQYRFMVRPRLGK